MSDTLLAAIREARAALADAMERIALAPEDHEADAALIQNLDRARRHLAEEEMKATRTLMQEAV